jgi:mRNA interferase MazF
MKRGDVYFVKAGSSNNTGYTVWTGRPAVVLSVDTINELDRTVEVVFLTSAPKQESPFHVSFFCRDRKATALCEQVTTLDTAQLDKYVTRLSENDLQNIEHAVAKSLGLDTVCVYGTPDTPSDGVDWKAEANRWRSLYQAQLEVCAKMLNDKTV